MRTNEQLIAAVRVTRLFGLYTYHLPESGMFSNATILYGDNGVGKSTLLRLAFHLLSAADNRGHRTALYNTVFDQLEVDLTSGVSVVATRSIQEGNAMLSMTVIEDGQAKAVWNYKPRAEESAEVSALESIEIQVDSTGKPLIVHRRKKEQTASAVPSGERAFLTALGQFMPTVFILTADRQLDSDAVPDPSDEVELRRVMHYGEPKRITDLVARSREIALSQAMNTAGKWIARKAVQAANQGSVNVHAVYSNVLRHLTRSSTRSAKRPSADVETLIRRLADIKDRTSQYSRYEFETPLETDEFQAALHVPRRGRPQLAASLLRPYVESTEGRLNALEPIYNITDRFVSTVNNFLTDKTITYTLTHGLAVHNRLQKELAAGQLSSGEQQLLLLFCYVLTARDQPSVFMIDEPEISLNIKWQRQLVQALLDITQDAKIQFVLASHSMELLAQHRDRVVKLTSVS